MGQTHRYRGEITVLLFSPRDDFVSHGAPLGDIFCWPHTWRPMHPKCAHDVCARVYQCNAPCGFSGVHIFTLWLQEMQVIHVRIREILIMGKTQIPKLEPYARKKLSRHFRSLIYICAITIVNVMQRYGTWFSNTHPVAYTWNQIFLSYLVRAIISWKMVWYYNSW